MIIQFRYYKQKQNSTIGLISTFNWWFVPVLVLSAYTIRQQIIDAIDTRFKTIRKYGLGEGPLGEGFLGGDMGDSIRQQIINAIDTRFKTIS